MSGLKIETLAAAVRRRVEDLAPGSPGISQVVAEIATETGYSERQVWRALGRFREAGVLPTTGAFTLTDDHIEAIATTRGNVQAARNHLDRLGEPVPSASTWARAAQRDIGKRLLATFKDGARGIRRTQIYLTAEDRPRNHTWQMDHAHLPLRVLIEGHEEPTDVWLTSIIDVGTRFLVGWALTPDRADSDSVREALLMALYGCRAPDGQRVGGVPELVLWDRGLEFLSDLVLATTDSFRFLGIALPPFSPHRKGKIERWFRTVKSECIDHLVGGTRGPTDLRGRHYNSDEVIELDALCSGLADYIDRYNFERFHSSIGCTPWAAWCADTTAVRPAPKHAIFGAMIRAGRRYKVNSRGVHFRKGVYKADQLAAYHGLTVEVRYLPNDLDTIEVFHDGRHVCTAIEKEAMSSDDREAFLKERTTQRMHAQGRRRAMQKRKVDRANQHVHETSDEDGPVGSLAAQGAAALQDLLAAPLSSESGATQLEFL